MEWFPIVVFPRAANSWNRWSVVRWPLLNLGWGEAVQNSVTIPPQQCRKRSRSHFLLIALFVLGAVHHLILQHSNGRNKRTKQSLKRKVAALRHAIVHVTKVWCKFSSTFSCCPCTCRCRTVVQKHRALCNYKCAASIAIFIRISVSVALILVIIVSPHFFV